MTEQIFSFKNTCKSSLFQIYINMNIQLSVIVFGLLLNLIETQYNFYIILIQGVQRTLGYIFLLILESSNKIQNVPVGHLNFQYSHMQRLVKFVKIKTVLQEKRLRTERSLRLPTVERLLLFQCQQTERVWLVSLTARNSSSAHSAFRG